MINGQNILSVIILTYNEEMHIERALRSLEALKPKIYIVDSFSSDRTAAIVEEFGANFIQHQFINNAQQFQWALDALSIETEWVMRLDADEILSPELLKEMAEKLPEFPLDITGVNINRRHIFLDRWIRNGGRYPLTLLRIWRKGAARIEQRWMDEHMVLLHGRTVTLDHDFSDHNLKDLTFFTDKHNKYATREAIDVLNKQYGLFDVDEQLSSKSSSFQAALKRWIKRSVYNRLPLWAGPLGYFLFRYIFLLGFLDGEEGLIYHFLQGYWYRFLVGAKVKEFDRVLERLSGPDERRKELERLSGYRLIITHGVV